MASPYRAVALLLLVTGACADDSSPVVTTPDVVTRVRAEPAGANCAHGGHAVSSGLDTDSDNVLDDPEVQGTRYVCSEADAQALARRDDEPAGEHCARGGSAIRSGIDRDANGVLSDSEVSATTYVCRDALLLPMSRFDAEPAGEHCAAGGTAVRTGLDRDGDSALGDAEIDSTSYVCDDVALTRVVVEPVGANCRAGGVAVRSGADRDDDGVLDDAEITDTDYVCGTVIDGDVEVMVQSQLDALRGIEAITGNLTIRYARGVQSVELPALRVVGGDVEINTLTNAARVELPRLRSVAGSVEVRSVPNLASLDLPALQDAAWIDIADNAALAAVRLPGLTSLRGSLSLRHNPITERFDLTSLHSAQAVTLWNLQVGEISLPSLWDTRGLTVVDCSSTSFSAPDLRSVLGDVLIGRNPALRTLSLPILMTIEGDLLFRDMPQLAELALPSLETLGNNLDVWDNATLVRLSMPKLRTVPGWFWFMRNPALESFAGLPLLSAVHGQFQFFGNRAMTDMSGLVSLRYIGGIADIGDTRLTRIGMPNLATVYTFSVGRSDRGPIFDNPLLETVDLPSLKEARSFIVMEAPRITRLDVPQLKVVNWLFMIWGAPQLRRCDLEAFVRGLAVPPDEIEVGEVDETPCE